MANTLTQWRPGFWYYFDENGYELKAGNYLRFKTYRELKKELPKYLKYQSEITVTRSRRGDWGEWFEKWQMVNGKPKIVKQDWN